MTKLSTPNIVPLKDVAVAPFVFKSPIFYGGIDAAVVPPEGRMRHGKGMRDEPQEIARKPKRFFGSSPDHPRLKGRYVFGGPLWNHFGHFFVDCIHRLWALKASGKSYDGIVFVAVQGLQEIQKPEALARAKVPKFLADLMRLLDMPPVPVIFIREVTVIEHLDVPQAGTAPRAPISPFYRYYLDRYQESLADKVAVHIARAPERIYCGRSHLLRKGGILGCSYFEARMKEAGVYCSTPEEMSLGQQLGHLMGAKTLVFDEGSSAHPTQVLSQVDTEFLMLPRRAKNNIYGMAISQRAPFQLLCKGENVETLPDRYGGTTSPGGMGVYRVPQMVYNKLRRRGLVTEPLDMEAYRAAEEADLVTSQSNTEEVHAKRLALLRDIRG